MSTIFSRLWPGFALAIILALGCLLLYSKCNKSVPAVISRVPTDSAAKADSAYHLSLQATIERLQGDSTEKADSIDNLSRENAWYEAALSTDDDQLTQTMAALDSARSHHDTVEVVAICDSLEGEVVNARKEVLLYKGGADSLIQLMQRQGDIKDSTAAVWHSAYLHADSLNVFYKGQYDTLYSAYVKQGKKLKRSSFIGKVLGGAAGVFLLVLILK